ncbi:hypothetical protein L3Q82_006199 [Scortum barcoo]|uniref:Uncharacterized protein n=1 Tax=Scortum barcoo TaxID=214431 RepID=A0ACB8X2R7_9TELE|nr:hypothetical protein L3Q82_006199 [Scortum barcoo]
MGEESGRRRGRTRDGGMRKPKSSPMNDYRPVALTSTIMKCFERSTEDAIALTLHTALSHLDQRDTYVRMLFIDYSSAFNTIVPSKLVTKLRDLGLNSALCDWILNFLTGRPQAVRMGSTTSSTLTLNTGAPQGCVLSPLLYSLFTHDCVATHSSNTIIKFADDTTVIGLITGDDEDGLQRGGQSPDILVPGQQPPAQRQQN